MGPDLMFFICLLTAPTFDGEASLAGWKPEQKNYEVIQKWCVQEEILDPKEVKYMFVKEEDLENDIGLVFRRYHELKDAPKLSDNSKFPWTREEINEKLAFNRAYKRHLELCMPLEVDRQSEYKQVIKECDQLYAIWDALRDSKCDFYYTTIRRAALKTLRKLIGEEDYMLGKLPPYVPVWRFAEIPHVNP